MDSRLEDLMVGLLERSEKDGYNAFQYLFYSQRDDFFRLRYQDQVKLILDIIVNNPEEYPFILQIYQAALSYSEEHDGSLIGAAKIFQERFNLSYNMLNALRTSMRHVIDEIKKIEGKQNENFLKMKGILSGAEEFINNKLIEANQSKNMFSELKNIFGGNFFISIELLYKIACLEIAYRQRRFHDVNSLSHQEEAQFIETIASGGFGATQLEMLHDLIPVHTSGPLLTISLVIDVFYNSRKESSMEDQTIVDVEQ